MAEVIRGDERIHTFYIAVFFILGGLLVIAMYWLSRCDEIIKEMARALANCANQIQFASGVIADQRARIRALEDEIARLTDSNIIELPRHGSQQQPRLRPPRS